MADDVLVELIQKNGNGLAFSIKEATAVADALRANPELVLQALGFSEELVAGGYITDDDTEEEEVYAWVKREQHGK